MTEVVDWFPALVGAGAISYVLARFITDAFFDWLERRYK